MNWDFLGALPALGPSGLLIAVIAILIRLWMSSESRHKSELERVNNGHKSELSELKSDIAELRKDVDDLRNTVENERRLRFDAETEAHKLRIQLFGRGTNE